MASNDTGRPASPLSRHAHSPLFIEALERYFPGAIPETVFVGHTYERLYDHGFDESNTIACVSVCRDELTHGLVGKLASAWGEAFNFSSLAGMLNLGLTGFGAALAHAPRIGGRERYCFFVLPHIGIDGEGRIGHCERRGQLQSSNACGALWAFVQAVEGGQREFKLDLNDIEQSLLCQAVMHRLEADEVPDLLRTTRLTQAIILEDLEYLIERAIDPAEADYAVLTGLQVHGTDGRDFVDPGIAYAVVNGIRHQLTI